MLYIHEIVPSIHAEAHVHMYAYRRMHKLPMHKSSIYLLSDHARNWTSFIDRLQGLE